MCRLKDTDLGIRKLAFGEKRGKMAVYLSDGREVLVPISLFPEIKRLNSAQREDWMDRRLMFHTSAAFALYR